MRRIAIVGAGQAGLQLALGLRAEGAYEVTVVTDRTPERIRAGRVMSTQLMFGPALALERAAGLNLWDDAAPPVEGLSMASIDPPGARIRSLAARLDTPARSVDQRLKTARWLELFEERGGRVEYRAVTPADLGDLASAHDLTVVASGRSALAGTFARDDRHSPYDRPQRALACVYLHGVGRGPELPGPHGRLYSAGDAGEFFVLPALVAEGPCHILFWEGRPGGPLDCWQDRPDPDATLKRSLELLRRYAPWEYELCAKAEPTDAGAALFGAVTPTVRRPVAEVAPGRHVLGMADAVVLNDPVTGQGSNSAARCAAGYLRSVTDRGEGPFDRAWMSGTFAAFWEHARHVTAFTNLMLGPRPEHVRRVLTAAAGHPEVAHRYVNGYADPAGFQEWLTDPDRADAYLAAIGSATVRR
ncbi:styrene monooxygenase/indole monooxygenase family protein [Streptomyces syringium]|uniref:styrene monooxygenase/indole monooxygenase family protein n=1 Tax=Streptomyces syringium TaxID=76729 RepID=UPI003AAA2D2F